MVAYCRQIIQPKKRGKKIYNYHSWHFHIKEQSVNFSRQKKSNYYHNPKPTPFPKSTHPNSETTFNSNIAHMQLQNAGLAEISKEEPIFLEKNVKISMSPLLVNLSSNTENVSNNLTRWEILFITYLYSDFLQNIPKLHLFHSLPLQAQVRKDRHSQQLLLKEEPQLGIRDRKYLWKEYRLLVKLPGSDNLEQKTVYKFMAL